MHTHMHRIQLNAYLICTLYIGYAHTCICMYLTVSACILAHWSCIKCICACMSYTYMPAYMQIHTHMHCSKAMHMCMYFCHEYMHMCIFESSAYLYVSDCISRSHTFTYASILWFLLRQIGRPQQRATREFSCEFSHLPLPPQRPGRRGRLLPLPARPAPARLPPRAPRGGARGGSGVEAPVPPGAVWGWGRRSCRRRSPSAAGGGAGGGGQLLGRGRRQRRRRKWNRPPA
jgi:hypothetical protein